MGDVVEMWKAQREKQKAVRRSKLEMAEDRFDELKEVVERRRGYRLVNSAPGHWLITLHGRSIIQYWPSADKWQFIKNSKIRKGNLAKFKRMLEGGKF